MSNATFEILFLFIRGIEVFLSQINANTIFVYEYIGTYRYT